MKKLLAGLLLPLSITACSRPIPPEVREPLEAWFSGRPTEHGWTFVKLTHGFGGQELVADMRVPEPLPGDPGAQRELVKSRLCPAGDNAPLWQKLKGYKLSVAVYTQDRKFTVLADCDNPYGRETAAGP
jgi:hypothetical protein